MHAAFPWGPIRHCRLLLLPLLKLLPNCLCCGGFGCSTWSQRRTSVPQGNLLAACCCQHSLSKLNTLCQVHQLPNSLIISVYLMYALMLKARPSVSKEGCHNAAVCHNPEGGRHFPQLWFIVPFDSHSLPPLIWLGSLMRWNRQYVVVALSPCCTALFPVIFSWPSNSVRSLAGAAVASGPIPPCHRGPPPRNWWKLGHCCPDCHQVVVTRF